MTANEPSDQQLQSIIRQAQSEYQKAILYAAVRLGPESIEAQGYAEERIARVLSVLEARG